MRKLTKRSTAIVAASVVAVGAAGAAYAWSLTATGTASASASYIAPLTTNPTIETTLYPGAYSDINISVVNPNNFPVVISGGTLSVTGSGSCSDTNFAAPAFTLGTAVTVAPLAGTGAVAAGSVEIPNAIRMLPTAVQHCVGAGYTVEVNLTANTPS